MSLEYKAVTKPLKLGEGPHWDISSQTLYFVDIRDASVHSYKPSTGESHSAIVGDGSLPVTLIIPVEGQKDKFLISLKTNVALIDWDGKSSTASKPEIIATLEDIATNRINDGKADSNGRLWAGTMQAVKGNGFEPVGSLYMVNNSKISKMFNSTIISNGLTWSLDNKKFYYIDSFKYCIESYDYDSESGSLSNKRIIFDFKKKDLPGFPDGMTIDAEGKLFVANYDGWQVLRIDPDSGELLMKIPLPAKQITSVAFGGPDLDELYVTSANVDPVTDNPAPENGENGCLFKVTNLGVEGVPMNNVN